MAAKNSMNKTRFEALGRFLVLTGTAYDLILGGYRTQGQIDQLFASLDAVVHSLNFALQEFKDAQGPSKAVTVVPDITTRPAPQLIHKVLKRSYTNLLGLTIGTLNFLSDNHRTTIQSVTHDLSGCAGYNKLVARQIERGLAVFGLYNGMDTGDLVRVMEQTTPWPTSKTLDRLVETLELSSFSKNMLRLVQILTIRQLVAQDKVRIVQRFGHRSATEIKHLLAELGLWLGMTEAEIAAVCLDLPSDDVLQHCADSPNDTEPTPAE